MYNEISYQKIRSYLLGELTPEESKGFEAKLKADAELAKEVEIQRNLLPVLDRLKERELQSNFQEWKKELEEEKEPPRRTWFRWYFTAIAILLVVIGALFFIWKNGNNPSESKEGEIPPTDTTSIQTSPPYKSDSIIEKDPSIVSPNNSKSKPKTVTSPNDSIQIVAVKKLAEDLIASIDLPKVPNVRGEKEEDAWKKSTMEADTATKLQNFEKALKILNTTTTDIPKAHLYSRLAYLYSKTGNHELAISNYEDYIGEDWDATKTNWELSLYYLDGYPDYEKEFWKKIDLILTVPEHQHYSDAEKLVAKLKAVGVVQ